MTKKVISNEMKILKSIHDQGMSVPLDLNDINAVIDYIEDLEKQLDDYKECIDLIVIDLRKHDYTHIIIT